VEDADSREPLPGVRIFSADSSSAVLTDSLGTFAIPLPAEGPLVVRAERLGYIADRFELADDAPSRISVLLLEPAPIQIEGITVVDEDALTTLVLNIESRRNGYAGAMRAFDRGRLERERGSVLEFVEIRNPWIRACGADPLKMCVRGRGATMANLNPQDEILVCVDELESHSPFAELGNLPIEAVALVEIFSR
jgi:hypothetical protein